MINVAICDDEKYDREQLENVITKYFTHHQIKYHLDLFVSGEEFCSLGHNMAKYDVVFLDISMGGINGMEVAYKIRAVKSNTYIVFVTGFINYIFEGYKVDAIRYIMKDKLAVSVVECLDAIISKMNTNRNKIEILFIEGKRQLYIDQIFYIESQKHKLFFEIFDIESGTYNMYEKLDNLEQKYKEYGFLRIHKSYLVNMKYITKIVSYKAILISGLEIPIPKQRYQAVKEAFALYKGEL